MMALDEVLRDQQSSSTILPEGDMNVCTRVQSNRPKICFHCISISIFPYLVKTYLTVEYSYLSVVKTMAICVTFCLLLSHFNADAGDFQSANKQINT